MHAYRRAADLLTGLRALLVFALPWLGWTQGAAALEAVLALMLLNWILDLADGALSRLDRVGQPSRLGRNDLAVDAAIGLALALYLALASFLPPALVGAYILVWLLVFWRWGVFKAGGLACQGIVYAYLVWLALDRAPGLLYFVGGWMLILLALKWRRLVGILHDPWGWLRQLWASGRKS